MKKISLFFFISHTGLLIERKQPIQNKKNCAMTTIGWKQHFQHTSDAALFLSPKLIISNKKTLGILLEGGIILGKATDAVRFNLSLNIAYLNKYGGFFSIRMGFFLQWQPWFEKLLMLLRDIVDVIQNALPITEPLFQWIRDLFYCGNFCIFLGLEVVVPFYTHLQNTGINLVVNGHIF